MTPGGGHQRPQQPDRRDRAIAYVIADRGFELGRHRRHSSRMKETIAALRQLIDALRCLPGSVRPPSGWPSPAAAHRK
jgi:hypothetical protein